MAALSVDKVFRFVQFVSNQESRGWISPEEFNIAAELAQIEAYSKREAVFLQTKKILNDLRPFMKTDNSPSTDGPFPSIYYLVFPSDLRHLVDIGLYIQDGVNPAYYRSMEEITQGEKYDRLGSSLIPITEEHPIFIQGEYNGSEVAEVWPKSLFTAGANATFILEYLSSPTAPEWAYTITSNRPVYNSGGSTDFQFDEVLFPEIAMSILQHVGLNVGREEVTQYAAAFNKGA